MERMRTAAGIARTVMAEVDGATATETQKAAAEMMTARIIELAADENLKSKDIAMISGAIRDCAKVAQDADKYIRTQIAERTKQAKAKINNELKDVPAAARKAVMDVLDEWALGVSR
jgi:hypothetical protein